MFLIVCLDRDSETEEMHYYLATHTIFVTKTGVERYKKTIAAERLPLIVAYDGKPLRRDGVERGFELLSEPHDEILPLNETIPPHDCLPSNSKPGDMCLWCGKVWPPDTATEG